MYCEKCGKELDADAVFCENCGAKVIPIPPPVEEKAADDGMVQTGQMAGAMPTEGSQTGQMAGTMPTGGPQMGQVVGAMPTGGPQTGQPMGAMPRKPVKKSVIAAAILAILVIVGAVIGVNLYENRKTEIDLKSYYSIKFTGIAPNGEAEVEFDYDKFVRDYRGKIRTKLKGSDREIVEALVSDCGLADYSLKKSENLSNGDEVTLSIRTNDEKALKDYHVRFKSNRIMKKVSGLSYYVTKLSELKKEDLNNLKKTAEDALTAKIASEYSGYLAGQGMKYLGGYTLVSKDAMDADNKVILVYKYSVKIKDETWSETETAYWYTSFDNVLMTSDGEAKYSMMDYRTPDRDYNYDQISSEDSDGWTLHEWNVYGYRSLALLYNDLVTQYVDEYEHEDAVTDAPGDVIGSSETKDLQKEDQKKEASVDGEDTDGVIFPDALTKKITEEEIEDLSDEELQTAINDLSAMAGYVFTTKTELNDYYKKFDWYKPKDDAKPSKKTLGKIGYSNYMRLVEERKERE